MGGRLGYRGFMVEARDVFGHQRQIEVGAGSNPQLELALLNSATRPLDGGVKRYIRDFLAIRVRRGRVSGKRTI